MNSVITNQDSYFGNLTNEFNYITQTYKWNITLRDWSQYTDKGELDDTLDELQQDNQQKEPR